MIGVQLVIFWTSNRNNQIDKCQMEQMSINDKLFDNRTLSKHNVKMNVQHMEDLSRRLFVYDWSKCRNGKKWFQLKKKVSSAKLFNVNTKHWHMQSIWLINWIPFESIVIQYSTYWALDIGYWVSDMDFVFKIPF